MRKLFPTKSLNLALLGFATLPVMGAKTEVKHPNVLFIPVDDLKPLITAYGDKMAI